jgi:hypothetical protein
VKKLPTSAKRAGQTKHRRWQRSSSTVQSVNKLQATIEERNRDAVIQPPRSPRSFSCATA